jgi:hypothetical protein
MANETTVDQRNTPQNNDPDPNVTMPRHVREAAERAENFYKKPEPTAEEAEAQRVAAEAETQRLAQEALNQPPANQPLDPNQHPQPQAQQVSEEGWQQRFLSMQGRWKASQTEVGRLQEQLVQVGDELGRATELLSRAGVQQHAPAAGHQPQPGHVHGNLITDQDRETYGDDMIDLASRVAKAAIAPELDALRTENAELKKNQITTAQKDLRAALQRAVPSWKAIQADPRWGQYLRLPNVYTNELRSKMLKDAWDAADASRTIAIFQDFVKEVQATGGQLPSPQPQPQPLAPRAAAMNLEDLTAPGRARPASGDNQVPADKPYYTRADISKFYADSRKGLYAGRQAEYDRIQNDLTAAQREGRIRG